MDNDAASNTLIRGDCADPFLAAMIKAFWKLAENPQLDVWIGRVGSKVNPTDLTARREKLPFELKRRVRFGNLPNLFNADKAGLDWDKLGVYPYF